MKNTQQYSQRIKKLYNALKKGVEKPKKPVYQNLVEGMIFAALCQNSSESAAKSAVRKIQSHFVDCNDLRVARIEEIVEAIAGCEITDAPKTAANLVTVLNAIFQKYDCLTPEDLLASGKKNAKEILEKFNGMTSFICNYVMLTVFHAHTLPINDRMIEYLKTNNLIDPQWDNAEIVSFTEKQVSASDDYAFYSLIRHDSEMANPKGPQILADGKEKPAAQKKPKTKK